MSTAPTVRPSGIRRFVPLQLAAPACRRSFPCRSTPGTFPGAPAVGSECDGLATVPPGPAPPIRTFSTWKLHLAVAPSGSTGPFVTHSNAPDTHLCARIARRLFARLPPSPAPRLPVIALPAVAACGEFARADLTRRPARVAAEAADRPPWRGRGRCVRVGVRIAVRWCMGTESTAFSCPRRRRAFGKPSSLP